jgi:hypothetical protein
VNQTKYQYQKIYVIREDDDNTSLDIGYQDGDSDNLEKDPDYPIVEEKSLSSSRNKRKSYSM